MNHQPLETPHIKKGKYQHFKGMLYEVLDVVHHSETQEALVLYRALYGEHGLWVRPFHMFVETIERDGEQIPRFKFLEEFID
jgi:hypothetical protein